MDSTIGDDLALARRLLRADPESFSAFFDLHFGRLYRFAVRRLEGDGDAAEDAVQATLIKALDRLSTYRGEAPMFTWLCTICRRQIADLQRARGRAPTVPLEDGQFAREILDALAASAEDPEESVRRREIAELVHVVLDHLPPSYAEALDSRYLQGSTVSEVATRLGLGYKAAESVLSRARAAFRRCLASLASLDSAGVSRG